MKNDVAEIKYRIIRARNVLNLTQKQVAIRLKSRQYTISRQESGAVYPSLQYLSFLEHEGINLNWVFSGNGNIINKKETKLELIPEA